MIVKDNLFIGTIRDGFDQFTQLEFADFRNNQFEGTLPVSIFDVPTLKILYFSDNALEGTIPPNFANSPVLRDLFLSNNQLSGTVPDIEPGQLSELNEFLVDSNQLTGSMPSSVCLLRVEGVGVLEDLWADCDPTADPRLECDLGTCCTSCYPITNTTA